MSSDEEQTPATPAHTPLPDPWMSPQDRTPTLDKSIGSAEWTAPQAPPTPQPWVGPNAFAAPGGPQPSSASVPTAPPAPNPFAPPGVGAPGGPVPPPPISPDGPGHLPYGYPQYPGAHTHGGVGYSAPGYGGAPGYGVPGYAWPGMAPPPSNGMGIAAMVLGIGAAALFCLWPLAILLGIMAVIFGCIGRAKARRGEATNPGHALAGIICGAAGVLLGIGFIVLIVVAPDGASDDSDTDPLYDDGYSTSLSLTLQARDMAAFTELAQLAE